MSHSTFNRLRTNISVRFGDNKLSTYSESEVYTARTMGIVIGNYLSKGYKRIPFDQFAGATFNNLPIVNIVTYNGYGEVDFVIFTRNE